MPVVAIFIQMERLSAQVTFPTRRYTCPPVNLHNTPTPVKKEVKYLGLHLDEKLTWKTHIETKRCQLELEAQKHEPANKRTLTAIPRQHTDRIQGNTATHLDIRYRAMGMQKAIQHQDSPNIPVKNAQNYQQYSLVRLQPNFAQ